MAKIQIDFIHYSTNEEAAEKWYERSKRINRENLYIIVYSDAPIKEIKRLENVKCKNKILISYSPVNEISWSTVIKQNCICGIDRTYLSQDILGFGYYEKHWDFVDFLNT